MFDFDKIAQAMEGVGELDALLRSILAEQRTTNMLLAMTLANNPIDQRDEAADIAAATSIILHDAHSIANDPDART